MSNNVPIITSLEALRTLKQQKYNPLRSLTPSSLARVLESFDIGYLRDGAILFETIAERDDTIKSVKPKREKDVSQLERQVLALPGSGAAGDAQRQVLEDFWNNVRAVNAYDRNERGGFRRLVKQMMSAVSYRYACHHIVWHPYRGQLRATFEFVPLWLFENRSGILRYLRDPFSTSGEMLDPSEWMITQGDGLMIACSIGYLAKRGAFNDWLIFSEKFSVPGILGRTVAKKGSAEAEAMRAAVESFGHDWTCVIYGDDGTHQKPLEIIQAAGNPSGMPMPAVVERVDRKIAAMYRGADLSTMSAGSGEGSGASLQGKETEILLADDAETINETLAEVSRLVIEWHFGRGTEPLAAVNLVAPSGRDDAVYLTGVQAMVAMGVKVAKDAVLERLGIQEAGEGEEFLAAPPPVMGQGSRVMGEEALANSSSSPMTHQPMTDDLQGLQDLRAALAEDLQPLGDALYGALQTGDQEAMNAALRKISASMPEFMDSPALTTLLGERFATALAGDTEAMANGDLPGHLFHGNQHTGDWRSYGLLPSAKIAADPASAPIPAYTGAARLLQGETVHDDAGNRVAFTDAVLEHWISKPRAEQKARLAELDDAENAVRNPHEVWRNSGQTVYLRKYTGHGPTRWMAVFVPKDSTKTYYSSDRVNKADEKFRRGTLLRKR